MGAVIMELLKANSLLPELSSSPAKVVVFAMQEDLRSHAVAAAADLRAAGIPVDLVLEAKKTKWVFKHADRLQASFVAIIGSAEVEKGTVRLKYLVDGSQEDVPVAELPQRVAGL